MFDRRLDFGRTDLVLSHPRNWMAVLFFGLMGMLHLAIALPTILAAEIEGDLGLCFGVAFLVVAIVCWLVRVRVSVLVERRQVWIGIWLGRCWVLRRVPFERIDAVRLLMASRRGVRRHRIQLVCADGDIECPVTPVPRQQALCMAMTIGARLIRVCGDNADVGIARSVASQPE